MSDKTGSDIWVKIGVVVSLFFSITGLLISVVQTYTTYDLTRQANELTRKSQELQEMLSNFTAVIDPDRHAVGLLYANSYDFYPNGSIKSFSNYGHLNVSLRVITPHFGNVSIEIVNFTTEDAALMLNTEMLNETTVSYVWEDEKYNDLVIQGLNSLDASLELKGMVYSDPSMLSVKGETHEFPIGWLNLNATFFDFHNYKTTTREFSALIRVRITVPLT